MVFSRSPSPVRLASTTSSGQIKVENMSSVESFPLPGSEPADADSVIAALKRPAAADDQDDDVPAGQGTPPMSKRPASADDDDDGFGPAPYERRPLKMRPAGAKLTKL